MPSPLPDDQTIGVQYIVPNQIMPAATVAAIAGMMERLLTVAAQNGLTIDLRSLHIGAYDHPDGPDQTQIRITAETKPH